MNFESWRSEGRLRPHKTTREEIQGLLDIAQRDLSDAAVIGLSTVRRFLIAYDAALTLSTVPLFCIGYETHGPGHHWITFRALPDVMGEEFTELADYFDICRTKRNIGTYDRSGQTSESEVEELLDEGKGFRKIVIDWLKRNYPEFS